MDQTSRETPVAEAAPASPQNPETKTENQELDTLESYEQYLAKKRQADVKRGAKNVLMMEQLADNTWRPVVPDKEKAKFLNKVGPLKSRQSTSWSNPSGSPRPGAGSSLSVATFAGVTDTKYINDMDRRLMYDKFKMNFREKTNIFPTEADIANAKKKPPHSPRAVSYVPVMVHMPITVKPVKKPHRLKPINREYDYPDEAKLLMKKKEKRNKMRRDRQGPTQYQSNTGLVMVMKPEQHALVGTVYENRPIKQEYNELIKFRLDPEKLQRENTMEILERCDELLNPLKAEKKRNRVPHVTPTDWNRTISATPNINDLRSVLGESPQGRKTRNSKTKEVPISQPISLRQIMKPDGKPKYYVDSVSKCVSWLNKNFS